MTRRCCLHGWVLEVLVQFPAWAQLPLKVTGLTAPPLGTSLSLGTGAPVVHCPSPSLPAARRAARFSPGGSRLSPLPGPHAGPPGTHPATSPQPLESRWEPKHIFPPLSEPGSLAEGGRARGRGAASFSNSPQSTLVTSGGPEPLPVWRCKFHLGDRGQCLRFIASNPVISALLPLGKSSSVAGRAGAIKSSEWPGPPGKEGLSRKTGAEDLSHKEAAI